MISGSNPPEPCLAQQAMQAYDLLDEAQMLTFISRNADSHPTGFPRSEHALTVLNDHTAILITDQQYIFLWHRTCSSGLFHPPRRQRTLKRQPPPEPVNERPIHLGGAVTRSSILHEALKRIETDVRLELGHPETGSWLGDDPPIDETAIHETAPTFLEELSLQVSAGAETGQLYQVMDDIAREIAQDLINSTPRDEIAVIEQAIRTAITAQEGISK